MKYLCIIGLLILSITGCQPTEEKTLSSGDHRASEVALSKIKLPETGLLESNFSFKNQWKIINIWAEWCKPCWQEIPELNRFQQQLEKDHRAIYDGVQLIGFNFDELELSELRTLKEKMAIDFPVIAVWPKEWPKTEIKGLPATVFISPDNEVIEVLFGPQDLKSLNTVLQRVLEHK